MLEAEKKAVHDGIKNYRGSKRRSELLGEAAGIIFMDDYAHHPTAIKTTLSGLKSFYPGRRIIVDFMSHTYSRTKALLDDFASSFNDADLVILNRIYSSAREKEESAGNLDNLFFEKTREKHGNVVYYDEPADAAGFLDLAFVEQRDIVDDDFQVGDKVAGDVLKRPADFAFIHAQVLGGKPGLVETPRVFKHGVIAVDPDVVQDFFDLLRNMAFALAQVPVIEMLNALAGQF